MPRNDDRPLNRNEQNFIRFYVNPEVRDIERAAQLAGLEPAKGKKLYNDPVVRDEIDRRLRLVELEQARLDAEAEVLVDSLLDQALMDAVKLDAAEHGSTKLAAITLAMVVKGRIETRHAKAMAMGPRGALGAQPQTTPGVYGSILPSALQLGQPGPATGQATTTVRRTEEVIQTHPHPAPPAQEPGTPYVFEVIEH